MGHLHSIYDSDSHFTINPITRAITNMSSQKTILMQYDHNSERFTFEIPRYIEGHDMSTCNRVEVHYVNVDTVTKTQNEGVYEISDLQISPESEEVVIGSWLISQNSTKLVGSLYFMVRFVCTTDGKIDYAWNTAICSINVSTGMYNSEIVVEEYADVLQQWYEELIGVFGDIESALDSIIAIQNSLMTITFTYAGTTYSALYGMTWKEWIDSEDGYNAGIFHYGDENIYTESGNRLINEDNEYQTINTVIVDGGRYRED